MKKWGTPGLLVILFALGCVGREETAVVQPPEQPTPTPRVNRGLRTAALLIDDVTATVEIADDDPTRNIGLMNRNSMPEDRGMLFVFPDSDYRSFWMKDTRIPLDIAYIGEDGTIKEILQMWPLDIRGTPSHYKFKYALEMNEGWFERHGVRSGDRIDLEAALEE